MSKQSNKCSPFSLLISPLLRVFHGKFSAVPLYLQVDKVNRKENNGADSQSDSQSSVSDSPSTAPPPLHRSQEFPRKPLEPFHLHSFPKVEKLHQHQVVCNNLARCVTQHPRGAGLCVCQQRALSTNKGPALAEAYILR